MSRFVDGPVSPCFSPVHLPGDLQFEDLTPALGLSERMAQAAAQAPRGELVAWGIPFSVEHPVLLREEMVSLLVDPPLNAGWLVFLHTSDGELRLQGAPDLPLTDASRGGFRGEGRLNEHAANYVIIYEDGSEERVPVRRRHQVGMYQRHWGENCFQAVAAHKPHPVRGAQEQLQPVWGTTQMRVGYADWAEWHNWLFAWPNPHPKKAIIGLRFQPVSGTLIVSGVSAGSVEETPLRWQTRRKVLLRLPEGLSFAPDLDENGLLPQIQIDLGQVISALPRTVYPDADWPASFNNQLPRKSSSEILIEYTAHPAACFHLWDGRVIPVTEVESAAQPQLVLEHLPVLGPVAPATRRVTLRVVEKGSRRPVATKLHVHGAAGEYLAPVDRHRIINPRWFEDYSVDFAHLWTHQTTYIPGETTIDLPVGKVYVEVAKGFEARPVRQVIEVDAQTETVVIELEKVLTWRERGWVTADTHVHFLSPGSAMLEGAGEGVNVINLLASQWGELMTNVGDFDGRTTFGTRESGGGPQGDGEYLVRVGTENRQHVLGHISLLGYRGRIIAPMTTGGPDESALGDPVEILLTEWARQCRKQGGVVVLPHFPNPRAEHAASIVSGDIDAIEMTAWGDLYSGISPYSLADWYRYLNCGYRLAAVGGTDKMAADTAVGTVRTYARIPEGQPFSYDAWMDAVRRAETFVTYGPLLELSVSGKPMGARITLNHTGGTLEVTWQIASVTIPTTQVDLMVNGVVMESAPLSPEGGSGVWSVKVEKSSWLALLVRGQYPGHPEIVAAHSSPVMVDVEGTQLLAAADAAVILDQIEGALAYLDTTGTRAEDKIYKRMRLVLESAYREVHNRMHAQGYYHDHNPVTQH